jgi:hypothetical protein
MTNMIGTMVIKRQAAMINRQLIQRQYEEQRLAATVGEDGNASCCRSGDTIDSTNQHGDNVMSKRRRVDQNTTHRSNPRLNEDVPVQIVSVGKKEQQGIASVANKATISSSTTDLLLQPPPPPPPFNNNDWKSDHDSVINPDTSANVSTCTASTTTTIATTAVNACTGNTSTATAATTATATATTPVTPSRDLCRDNDKVAMQLWCQVDRLKRISMFLQNAQIAQALLYEEMKDCYENHTIEFGGNDDDDNDDDDDDCDCSNGCDHDHDEDDDNVTI